MKKILLFTFLCISMTGHSQTNVYSKYTPTAHYQAESYNDMATTALEMRRKHDANLKYLYALKDWILDLKTKMTGEKYINKLNLIYKGLTEEQEKSLANSYPLLKKTETYLKELVAEYIEEQKKQ